MNYNRTGSGDIDALKATDGTTIANVVGQGVTLPVGTYYFPLGSDQAKTPVETVLQGLGLTWNAALAATITIEGSMFPAKLGGGAAGGDDVKDWAAAAGGNWIQDNDATGDKVYSAGGAGNAAAALTLTAGGAAVGGFMLHLRDRAWRRMRFKVVVTTQGLLRINCTGKLGA